MDKGWSAKQIIDQHVQSSPPPAPEGFGDEFIPLEPENDSSIQVREKPREETPAVEEMPDVEVEVEVESGPSEASLKRLKKAELMELAMLQGLDSSGTKADIIARLLS